MLANQHRIEGSACDFCRIIGKMGDVGNLQDVPRHVATTLLGSRVTGFTNSAHGPGYKLHVFGVGAQQVMWPHLPAMAMMPGGIALNTVHVKLNGVVYAARDGNEPLTADENQDYGPLPLHMPSSNPSTSLYFIMNKPLASHSIGLSNAPSGGPAGFGLVSDLANKLRIETNVCQTVSLATSWIATAPDTPDTYMQEIEEA